MDPRDFSDDPVEQERFWEGMMCAYSARNTCPFSGYSITRCKTIDLCDCFTFPEHEPVSREVDRVEP